MKQLFFVAVIAIAAVSCNKDKESLTTLNKETKFKYDNKNVEAIIQKADPKLYERVKTVFHPTGTKTANEPIVKIAHGICSDKKWYCIPQDCVCFIEVIFAKSETAGDDANEQTGDANDLGVSVVVSTSTETYTNQDARIILVKPDSPEEYTIEKMNTMVDVDGKVSFDFDVKN